MVTANSGEVGKVGNDRGLLAAEGQVDEILQLKKLQLVGHRLKLCGLAGVEAAQPFGKVIQLLHIDRKHFHSFQDSVETVDLLHLAVRLDRVADLQRLQQLHAVCVLVIPKSFWRCRLRFAAHPAPEYCPRSLAGTTRCPCRIRGRDALFDVGK